MICVGKEGLVGISITYIEAWVVALEERSRVVSPAEARSVPGCWSLPVLLLQMFHLAMAASRRSRRAGDARRRRVEAHPRLSTLLESTAVACLGGSFKVMMMRPAVRTPGSAAST